MRFAYEFYRRRAGYARCGDFNRDPIRIHRARNIERAAGIVGETAIIRFVCDERDCGCSERGGGGRGKGEKRGVLSN